MARPLAFKRSVSLGLLCASLWATGLQLTRPSDVWLFDSYTRMLFVVMSFMAVMAISIARYVQDSHIGQGLRAVRDSEEAADCSGVPTLKLKLIACAISGALLGVAGAPMPMYLSYVEPASTFNLHYAVIALAMPIIASGALASSGQVVSSRCWAAMATSRLNVYRATNHTSVTR